MDQVQGHTVQHLHFRCWTGAWQPTLLEPHKASHVVEALKLAQRLLASSNLGVGSPEVSTCPLCSCGGSQVPGRCLAAACQVQNLVTPNLQICKVLLDKQLEGHTWSLPSSRAAWWKLG